MRIFYIIGTYIEISNYDVSFWTIKVILLFNFLLQNTTTQN